MDIDRVRYFHIFAETGSFVKASEILHVSQPALSKAMRLLESEVNIKLFTSDGRGLKLTEEGSRFRQETSQLLQQWMNIPKMFKSNESWTPTRIGSFEVFTTYFLGRLADYIELDKLEIHELGPGKLENAIATRQVDIGITYVPVPKAGVEFIEVVKIKMGVYGLASFAAKEFASLPYVIPLLPPEGTPSKVVGLDGWPDHKFERNVKYRVTMMESAMELCRRGHCVAYLPEFVVELHNENVLAERRLKEIKSPLSPKERLQSVFLMRHKDEVESKLYRQMAKCLRSLK